MRQHPCPPCMRRPHICPRRRLAVALVHQQYSNPAGSTHLAVRPRLPVALVHQQRPRRRIMGPQPGVHTLLMPKYHPRESSGRRGRRLLRRWRAQGRRRRRGASRATGVRWNACEVEWAGGGWWLVRLGIRVAVAAVWPLCTGVKGAPAQAAVASCCCCWGAAGARRPRAWLAGLARPYDTRAASIEGPAGAIARGDGQLGVTGPSQPAGSPAARCNASSRPCEPARTACILCIYFREQITAPGASSYPCG